MPERNFWNRVKAVLKIIKATQKEAAAACNTSVRTFQNWINRDLYPTVLDGYHLAHFLGVSVEYLVTGKEGKTKKYLNGAMSNLKAAEEKLKKLSCRAVTKIL